MLTGARGEPMSETSILLKAYYEALYEKLEAKKEILAARIDEFLKEEIEKRGFDGFDEEKYSAYRDACLAFIDERIEAYNPFGIQYTYDRCSAREVIELEQQLNWYDSRDEFQLLVETARGKAAGDLTEERLRPLAEEMIAEVGVFPDRSIISAYEDKPGLNKLPDYIVARTIEQVIVRDG
jgi:oligoendopeptidase F